MRHFLRTPFFIKLRNWEYWNNDLVHLPLYPYWAWLSLKARSLYFLTAANPAIKNGGFIMESKKEVYSIMPSHLYPTTCYFEPNTPFDIILDTIKNAGIEFPLIAKPDYGERGLAVKKIYNKEQLQDYTARIPISYLVQSFVPYENEVGIFYCRMPGEEQGFISGIVNKEPVTVVGDGVSTVAELVKANDRYLLQWKAIQEQHGDGLDVVLDRGAKKELVPYGNHVRGSKFTDVSNRISPELNATLNKICLQIPEFYYGRLDIRFKNWEALKRGEEMSIIELNGSGSGPTHIYDPAHSIFFAWWEIARHWKILYQICRTNNRKGTPYVSINKIRADVKAFKEIDQLLSAQVW